MGEAALGRRTGDNVKNNNNTSYYYGGDVGASHGGDAGLQMRPSNKQLGNHVNAMLGRSRRFRNSQKFIESPGSLNEMGHNHHHHRRELSAPSRISELSSGMNMILDGEYVRCVHSVLMEGGHGRSSSGRNNFAHSRSPSNSSNGGRCHSPSYSTNHQYTTSGGSMVSNVMSQHKRSLSFNASESPYTDRSSASMHAIPHNGQGGGGSSSFIRNGVRIPPLHLANIRGNEPLWDSHNYHQRAYQAVDLDEGGYYSSSFSSRESPNNSRRHHHNHHHHRSLRQSTRSSYGSPGRHTLDAFSSYNNNTEPYVVSSSYRTSSHHSRHTSGANNNNNRHSRHPSRHTSSDGPNYQRLPYPPRVKKRATSRQPHLYAQTARVTQSSSSPSKPNKPTIKDFFNGLWPSSTRPSQPKLSPNVSYNRDGPCLPFSNQLYNDRGSPVLSSPTHAGDFYYSPYSCRPTTDPPFFGGRWSGHRTPSNDRNVETNRTSDPPSPGAGNLFHNWVLQNASKLNLVTSPTRNSKSKAKKGSGTTPRQSRTTSTRKNNNNNNTGRQRSPKRRRNEKEMCDVFC